MVRFHVREHADHAVVFGKEVGGKDRVGFAGEPLADLGIFQGDGDHLLNLSLRHRPDGDGHDAVFGQEVRG